MAPKENTTASCGRDNGLAATVHMKWRPERLPELMVLLSRGVIIKTRLDSSLRSVLCRELHTTREFLVKRVSAAFLNGKTVDDLDAARLEPEATVALTGCLTEPFLLHAFSQRWFRPEVDKDKGETAMKTANADQEAFFTLKVLNVLIQDFGPSLLESGIWVDTESLEEFFASRSPRFWTGIETASVDGEEIAPELLAHKLWSKKPGLVRLSVERVN